MCVFQGIWSEMIHHGLWCQIIHRDWGLFAEMQLHSDNGISSCCDRQDRCWEEVSGRTLDDIHPGQAQELGLAIPAAGESCSPFLYISQQSALVAIQHPMINHSTELRQTARWSPRPLHWLPTFLPPWIPSPSAPSRFINQKGYLEGCSFLFVLNCPNHATFPLNLDFCFTFLPLIASLFKRSF